jgi:hypothetical protein
LSRRRIEVDVGTTVIEFYLYIRITLGRLDDDSVEGAAADRVDALIRVAVVGREMERAGSAMDHAAAHRDGLLKDFIGDAELLEGVDATGGEGEIDRAAANGVARGWVGPALEEVDLKAAPAEEGGEQTSREATAYKNKFGHDQEWTNQER